MHEYKGKCIGKLSKNGHFPDIPVYDVCVYLRPTFVHVGMSNADIHVHLPSKFILQLLLQHFTLWISLDLACSHSCRRIIRQWYVSKQIYTLLHNIYKYTYTKYSTTNDCHLEDFFVDMEIHEELVNGSNGTHLIFCFMCDRKWLFPTCIYIIKCFSDCKRTSSHEHHSHPVNLIFDYRVFARNLHPNGCIKE